MNQYPILQFDKDEWNKKVNACLMYTIPSEDEALPILCQIQQILQRLHNLPIQQTIAEKNVQYFFLNVFPVVCQKIIKSRYFKNQTVLKKANQILQNTVCLLPLHINILDKIPQFVEVIQAVFPDQFYFKTNNQLEHKQQPYLYFPKSENQFQEFLQKGSKVDVIKFSANRQKYFWTHGTVLQVDQTHIFISYDLDYEYGSKKIQRNSYQIAVYQSKCTTFQWRKNIKVGDLVDVVDPFGGWYNATVIGAQEEQDGRRKIQVTIKVYNQNGNKNDENGKYFGFADYKEKYDAFSAEIAPYCSVAKEFSYESTKSLIDVVDDVNDMQCTSIEGKKIFALPRKKHLSQTIFKALNRFGEMGGFDKVLSKITEKQDIGLLSLYLKGLSGVSGYLHKQIVLEQVNQLKKILQQNILTQNNTYSKEKSQMLFHGLRSLLKRVFTSQSSYEYENNLKIRLVEQNFEHESLKKRLHGLNQLKEIVKTLTFGSTRNKKIIQWIKQRKIFQKVYLVNSHVQLIKKSESFFRYIINQNLLQIEDLEKLFKMAQKGDYETRISLYALFKEVSHIFKKHHVNFLIDRILESQPHLILKEDIDFLHELSSFSNYFPTTKVMEFFQKLILGEQIPLETNNYAIKKYSDIVAKNYQMKNHRKQVLKDLFAKLKTHDIGKVTKILKHIFEGIGFGQWGKKDLIEMLQDQNFDQVIISSIQLASEKKNKTEIIKQTMDLLLSIYKLCSSFKIRINTIEEIYKETNKNRQLIKIFYKWCNQVFKCQQGIQIEDITQLQELFVKLFEKRKTLSFHDKSQKSIVLEELDLLKSIFVEINKRKNLITVSNIMKDKQIERQYRRKVPVKQLTFYKSLFQFIFDSEDSVAQKSLEFFKQLYCSGENSEQEIEDFLQQNLQNLRNDSAGEKLTSQNKKRLLQTLKIIEFIIDDSEKECSAKIDSLISKKKNYEIKLNFINSVSYSTDTIKKLEVTIPANFTLFDLRMHLAKQLDIPWKGVKIQLKKEIPYLLNCRTIKELGLTGLQTLTVSRKIVPSQPEGQIIINGQINPKAQRVFKYIFDQYSTSGKMNKTQCHQFTVKCLGSSSSPKFYEDKINGLFKEYDEDQDDLLDINDFLKFYKSASISRSSTVWSNLRSFGIHGNFKFSYENNDEINTQKLPRKIMSQIPQIYDLLFRLLKQKDVSSCAFYLLQRLPVSRHVQEQILCVNDEQFNFEKMLDTTDLYEFFYKLNVIEYLVFSNQLQTEQQKDWSFRFIANEGFQKIIEIFFRFIEIYKNQSPKQKIILEIIDALIDISHHYLMKCYASLPVIKCQVLFVLDVELSEKIQYLVTGKFSKPEIKLPQIADQFHQEYDCKQFKKSEILNKIIDLFEALWQSSLPNKNGTFEIDTSNTLFLEQVLITKIMLFIPTLQVNQNFEYLISKLDTFIHNSKNQKYLKKLYELIICLAFQSDEGDGQKIIINQMFKHLTKSNIISQHFSVLAVLVSKYGVSTDNEDEIIEFLMKNIFKSNNELTIQGCSKLLHNFDLNVINEKQFDDLWENCLFGQQKRAKKNSTRQALYQLILKGTQNKTLLTDHIITKIKSQISECIEKMRITSCTQDNQRSLAGYAGLKNLGNICYINSMMQQLYMNKSFRYLILRINDYETENPALYKEKLYDDNILHQFQKIFAYLELTSRADYVPNGFCLAYKPFGQSVNFMIQQDVQQFVSMFFDQLQNKIKFTPFKKILSTFYGGKTTNLFNCHDCNQTKKVQENFYSITLQVKSSKSLQDSFNRYISGELISDFRCDFCNKKVDVSKKTRISQPPRTLLIHLQRIVFNLDTFINEKITTRHEFPTNLDLYPFSLAQYEKPKDINGEDEKKVRDSMQYNLSGIICHNGNAESGHYISYIKIGENKWVEFNDSLVTIFSESNIESQCFGGVVSNYMDEFEWDKSSETSKSAYILLYEKQGQTKIQAVIKCLQQKNIFLKEYVLSEIVQKISVNQNAQKSKKQQQEDSLSESESLDDDKLQQEILKLEVEQKIRKKSQDINLDLQKIETIQKQLNKNQELSIQIESNISFYVPENLRKQILHDNQIHFFEKNLSSPAFVKFFAHLLKLPHKCHQQIIKMLKSLTFGFWTKSQHFKDLLKTCLNFIEIDTKYADDLIFSNPQIITYLIENPDSQVRTSIAVFLSSAFTFLIEKFNLKLSGQNEMDSKIVKFLDSLFSLLPTAVSKAWTKFGQYFEFWFDFGGKGKVQMGYMIHKELLKHFLDYYLDKKSPLKIYDNKPQIGSKYANPNFTMLLKTVTSIISSILTSTEYKLSEDDYKILINFDCMEKLISQNYQNLAVNLIKELCKNNLYASQKIAIIILKGLHKSTFNNVQPYLDVLHSYALINDEHQSLRVKWVLGKPALHLSTIGKNIHAMTSFGFQQRVYTYHSSISLEQAASLLDPIYELHKRAQNFAMMSLKQVLKLCLESDFIFEYVWTLPPPSLCYGNVHQFYIQFIERYTEQAKRTYSYNQTGLNKQELGTEVKKMYEELNIRWNNKYPHPHPLLLSKQNINSNQTLIQTSSLPTSEESVPTSPERKDKNLELNIKTLNTPTYYPVKFNFIEKQKKEILDLQITRHESQLTLLLLKPNGKGNDSFLTGMMQKNIQKLKETAWQAAKIQKISGNYLYNRSNHLLRIKTQDGTQLIKPNDYMWVWDQNIEKVWICERTSDWPKWDLYRMENKLQEKQDQNGKI